MIGAGDLDHARTEIDADAARRPQLGQKPAGAATHLQDIEPFRNEKAEIAGLVLVEGAVALDEPIAPRRPLIGEIAQRRLARRQRPFRNGLGGGLGHAAFFRSRRRV